MLSGGPGRDKPESPSGRASSSEPTSGPSQGPPPQPLALLTPPQRTGPTRSGLHVNYHLQQAAAMQAAEAAAGSGPATSTSQEEGQPTKRPRRTSGLRPSPPGPSAAAGEAPSPSGAGAIAPALPGLTSYLPASALFPTPVDLLTQLNEAVADSEHTHAVVSLELLRMLNWRARRAFLMEREEQRAQLHRASYGYGEPPGDVGIRGGGGVCRLFVSGRW